MAGVDRSAVGIQPRTQQYARIRFRMDRDGDKIIESLGYAIGEPT
jgi:hypothetical protein